MIKVLIVNDSNVVAMLLKAVFSKEPDIEVLGHAENGKEALDMVQTLKPDLVTMDIHMPEMNGFEATHAIMNTCPTPVMLVSACVNAKQVHTTFQAIDEGAVAVVEQPQLGGEANTKYDPLKEFLRMVRLMSGANVNHNKPSKSSSPNVNIEPHSPAEVIAISSAEGGVGAIKQIVENLEAPGCPVIINQQLAPGFLEGLVTWLKPKIKMPLKLAQDEETLKNDIVYITPDGHDMSVVRNSEGLSCELTPFDTNDRLCPSADTLFHSIASVCSNKAVGVLLSGTNCGVEGIRAMKKAGALTLGQEESSALIAEGIQQAKKTSAADSYLSPTAIASLLSGKQT